MLSACGGSGSPDISSRASAPEIMDDLRTGDGAPEGMDHVSCVELTFDPGDGTGYELVDTEMNQAILDYCESKGGASSEYFLVDDPDNLDEPQEGSTGVPVLPENGIAPAP